MSEAIRTIPPPHFSDVPEIQEMLVVARDLQYKDGKAKQIKLYKAIEQKANELSLEKEKVHALSLLAKYSIDHEQYAKALEYIFQGLPLAQKHKLNARLSNFYNWLAGVHMFVGDYSNALDYFQLEIKHNAQSGIEQHSFSAYNLIGVIYYEMEDYETSELFYQKTLDIAKKHTDFIDVFSSVAHLNTGIIVLRIVQERYKEAKQLCLETIELITNNKINDKRLLPNVYSSLALIAYDLGNYEEGIMYALEADKRKENAGVIEIFYVYKVLALNYSKAGKTALVLSAFDKCISLFHSLKQISTNEIETLYKAKDFYEDLGHHTDAQKVQKIITKAELDFQTKQAKLSIRAEQLLATTVKYAPANLKPNSGKISMQVIGFGTKVIATENISICQTVQQAKDNKNACIVNVKDGKKNVSTYKVSMSLRKLYQTINNPDFVWLNRNIFINKNYVEDWKNVIESGKVTLDGKRFEVSRRNYLKLLKEINL